MDRGARGVPVMGNSLCYPAQTIKSSGGGQVCTHKNNQPDGQKEAQAQGADVQALGSVAWLWAPVVLAAIFRPLD